MIVPGNSALVPSPDSLFGAPGPTHIHESRVGTTCSQSYRPSHLFPSGCCLLWSPETKVPKRVYGMDTKMAGSVPTYFKFKSSLCHVLRMWVGYDTSFPGASALSSHHPSILLSFLGHFLLSRDPPFWKERPLKA